jgi:hypothetical protein
MQHLVVGNDRCLHQVESAQEREAERFRTGYDCGHQREALILHVAIECREVFDLLPRALPVGSNQQEERLGFRDFLGKLGQPEACAQ